MATYNLTMLLLPWLSALAMYLLVVAWTGVPAAGIAAGLLYGFHASKLGNVVHPFAEDTAWTVFGMLFLSRFFAKGRARDGVVAAVFQRGAKFHSLDHHVFVGTLEVNHREHFDEVVVDRVGFFR